jgi:hypothetical protein
MVSVMSSVVDRISAWLRGGPRTGAASAAPAVDGSERGPRRALVAAAVLTLAGGAAVAGWLITRSGDGPSGPRPVTPEPALSLGSTCTSRLHRFRIAYPNGWFASDRDPRLECRFFHPSPVEIPEHAGLDGIAVSILPDQGPYGEIAEAMRRPVGRLVSHRDATVDGRQALVTETEEGAGGYYAAGSRSYAYLVDVRGVGLIIGTFGFTGDEFIRYRGVVDAMVTTVEFLPGVRPGAASRTWIEVGQGVAGVTLGMSRRDVRDVLGPPAEPVAAAGAELGSVVEYGYPGLTVTFAGVSPTAVRIATRRPADRTRAMAGVGSSLAAVRARVGDLSCRITEGEGVCSAGQRVPGQRVTEFAFVNGVVSEVVVMLWRGGPAIVRVYMPRGDPGPDCDRVHPVDRGVPPPALAGAMAALLAGPTSGERARGYGGWFSPRTAGMLRSARVVDGVARIDFRDFSRIISGASASCGSAMLLNQLDRTALQFREVHRTLYSFDGSTQAFYEWLQRSRPSS